LEVRIVKGGVISGTDLGDNLTIPVGPSNIDYGGEDELWGLSWSLSDISENANFGCALRVKNDRGDDVLLDSLKITVYYTPP
jgi:hypothetical protein